MPIAQPWCSAPWRPVSRLVLPAVEVANFDAVRRLAHEHGAAYALGIHPLYVDRAARVRSGSPAPGLGQHRA
jgi:TatD DNase family protein